MLIDLLFHLLALKLVGESTNVIYQYGIMLNIVPYKWNVPLLTISDIAKIILNYDQWHLIAYNCSIQNVHFSFFFPARTEHDDMKCYFQHFTRDSLDGIDGNAIEILIIAGHVWVANWRMYMICRRIICRSYWYFPSFPMCLDHLGILYIKDPHNYPLMTENPRWSVDSSYKGTIMRKMKRNARF